MQKKIPMRMCVGCREMKPKKELIRVVRSPDNQVFLDLTGKKSGRGAYVCQDAACMEKAIKHKQLNRALDITLTHEVEEQLRSCMKAGETGAV